MSPITAVFAEAFSTYVTDLRERAVAAGKASDWMKSDVAMHLYADGTGVITIGGHTCGDFRHSIAFAINEAEEYIACDEKALANLAIGLTPDGRFAGAA